MVLWTTQDGQALFSELITLAEEQPPKNLKEASFKIGHRMDLHRFIVPVQASKEKRNLLRRRWWWWWWMKRRGLRDGRYPCSTGWKWYVQKLPWPRTPPFTGGHKAEPVRSGSSWEDETVPSLRFVEAPCARVAEDCTLESSAVPHQVMSGCAAFNTCHVARLRFRPSVDSKVSSGVPSQIVTKIAIKHTWSSYSGTAPSRAGLSTSTRVMQSVNARHAAPSFPEIFRCAIHTYGCISQPFPTLLYR